MITMPLSLRRWAAPFLVVAVGLIAYATSYAGSFHFDDIESIVENLSLRHLGDIGQIAAYRPTRLLVYLSLAVNCHLHGLHVFGYHVVNVAIHILASLAAMWLALITLRTPRMRETVLARHAPFIALATGLIFVAHPVQTQAVTYIIQRTTSMAGLFYLASLACYGRCRIAPAGKTANLFYAGSLLAAVAAMLSKEMAITLPFAIVLYEYMFFERGDRGRWKRLAGILATIVIIPATMLITRTVNVEELRLVTEQKPPLSAGEYFLTELRVIMTYLRLLVLPVRQNLDYDYAVSKSLFEPAVMASVAVISAMLIAALSMIRRWRVLSFCVFFFFLTLAPESGIIPIRDVIFEHRLYLPLFAFALFVPCALVYLLGEQRMKAAGAAAAALVCVYVALTIARNAVWHDELTLWDDTVRKSPKKGRPYYNRGLAYNEKQLYDNAIADYNRGLRLDPSYPDGYSHRGRAYKDTGDLRQAVADFNRALAQKPTNESALINRGIVFGMAGLYDRAVADFMAALKVKPRNYLAYNNLGNVAQLQKQYALAIDYYTKSLAVNPLYAEAYNNRAEAYLETGEVEKARADVKSAQELGKVHPKIVEELERATVKK